MALVEGVSLGTLAYQPPGPATGYVAFATVLLYLVGVYSLPQTGGDGVGRALVVTGTVVEEGLDAARVDEARRSRATLDA
jgi:hypothetical protein